MRPFLSALLLWPFAASAQGGLDQCLAPVPFASQRSVADAWSAALQADPHPEKKLQPAGSHPCLNLDELRATGQVLVLGCSADERVAAVKVGDCRGQLPDEPVSCGAAVVDLKQRAFTAFVPPRGTRGTQQRFFGNTLATSWEGGVELRFGTGLATSIVLPRARVLGTTAEPDLLLLAIVSSGHEALASFRLGSRAPVVLSGPAQEVRLVEPLTGTSLVTAELTYDEGPGALLVVDLKTGGRVFEVKGPFRHKLSPTGDALFVVVEEPDASNTTATFVHQLVTRDGKRQRLPSGIPLNGTAPVAASFGAGRAAIGGPGVVELISLRPLARIALVKPFGEKEKILMHTLRWIDAGQRLLAFAGEYVPATGKMRNLAALVNGADGRVLQTWRDTIPAVPEQDDPRLRQDTGIFLATSDGGLVRAPTAQPPIEPPSCESRAEELVKSISLQTGLGILLPARR